MFEYKLYEVIIITNNEKAYKFLLFYATGILFLYISVFLSFKLKYNGSFISSTPVIFPMVFAMAFVGISVLFPLDNEYPWLFRTGIMSLVIGITMSIFGITSYYEEVISLVWVSSVVMGVLFILAAFVRLIIQGGLSAYKKIRL
jgi:hypothetical protein